MTQRWGALNEHPDLKQRYDALRWIGWAEVAASGGDIEPAKIKISIQKKSHQTDT